MIVPIAGITMFILFLSLEYIGNVPAEKREEVIASLNNEANKLVKVSKWKILFVFNVFYDLFTGCYTCYCVHK